MIKKFAFVLLPGKNITDAITQPIVTRRQVERHIAPWGPSGSQWFYRFQITGPHDGTVWGIQRVLGPGGNYSVASKSSWSKFVSTLNSFRVNDMLQLGSSYPQVDPIRPENYDEETEITALAMARNIIPVGDLLESDEALVAVSVIVDSAGNWQSRPASLPNGKQNDLKWVKSVRGILDNFRYDLAVGLTLSMGKQPVIPTTDRFISFGL